MRPIELDHNLDIEEESKEEVIAYLDCIVGGIYRFKECIKRTRSYLREDPR